MSAPLTPYVPIHTIPTNIPVIIEDAINLIELITPDPKLSKSFRIQNKRLHLTYPSHFDPIVYIVFIKKTIPDILNYSVVQEIGATEYKHTHVLLGFSKIFQTTNARIFDYLGLHPNIKLIKTNVHWDHTVEYHKKQGVPYTDIVVKDKAKGCAEEIKAIWAQKSVAEALLNVCESVKQVGGVIAAFNCKPANYGEKPEVVWRPWQQDLYDEMQTEPDDRTIAWYWDPDGNSGKSFFAKHMGMYKGAFVTTSGNVYHVATSVQDIIAQGSSILSVVFNFTRQKELHKVYSAIEALKDGMVSSEKYHGKTIFFKCPHVVVFANYLPDLSGMSIDRWSIRLIDKDGQRLDKVLTGPELNTGMDTYRKAGYDGLIAAAMLAAELRPLKTPEPVVPVPIVPAFKFPVPTFKIPVPIVPTFKFPVPIVPTFNFVGPCTQMGLKVTPGLVFSPRIVPVPFVLPDRFK